MCQARRQGGSRGFARTPLLTSKRFYVHHLTVHFKRPTVWKRSSSLLLSRITVVQTSLVTAKTLAQEKGASSWLTTLPINEFGFALHKGAFQDALALRYGWLPLHAPTTCAMEHILSCPKGGFPSIRHNEIRDITATLLSEVCIPARRTSYSGPDWPSSRTRIIYNFVFYCKDYNWLSSRDTFRQHDITTWRRKCEHGTLLWQLESVTSNPRMWTWFSF